MRLFLDSNVWISALATRGICADLVREVMRRNGFDVARFTTAQVHVEVRRVLVEKFRVPRTELAIACAPLRDAQPLAPCDWRPERSFSDPDDVPILAAAVAGAASLFVTGDRELLALRAIGRLAIVDPRTAYLQLRGLA